MKRKQMKNLLAGIVATGVLVVAPAAFAGEAKPDAKKNVTQTKKPALDREGKVYQKKVNPFAVNKRNAVKRQHQEFEAHRQEVKRARRSKMKPVQYRPTQEKPFTMRLENEVDGMIYVSQPVAKAAEDYFVGRGFRRMTAKPQWEDQVIFDGRAYRLFHKAPSMGPDLEAHRRLWGQDVEVSFKRTTRGVVHITQIKAQK